MGNKPSDKIKISNNIEIAFWEKEATNKAGNKFKMLQPVITKSWLDQKTKEWQRSSINLGLNDLYRFFSVVAQVKKVEDDFKERIRLERVKEETITDIPEDRINEVMRRKDVSREGAIALIKANAV